MILTDAGSKRPWIIVNTRCAPFGAVSGVLIDGWQAMFTSRKAADAALKRIAKPGHTYEVIRAVGVTIEIADPR